MVVSCFLHFFCQLFRFFSEVYFSFSAFFVQGLDRSSGLGVDEISVFLFGQEIFLLISCFDFAEAGFRCFSLVSGSSCFPLPVPTQNDGFWNVRDQYHGVQDLVVVGEHPDQVYVLAGTHTFSGMIYAFHQGRRSSVGGVAFRP